MTRRYHAQPTAVRLDDALERRIGAAVDRERAQLVAAGVAAETAARLVTPAGTIRRLIAAALDAEESAAVVPGSTAERSTARRDTA